MVMNKLPIVSNLSSVSVFFLSIGPSTRFSLRGCKLLINNSSLYSLSQVGVVDIEVVVGENWWNSCACRKFWSFCF